MYRKILVPVDGSAASTLGLQEAVKLAKSTGGVLRIVHVVNELVFDTGYVSPQSYQLLFESFRLAGEKVLEGAQAVAREAGVEFTTELIETVGGRASKLILDAAGQWSPDLIVMGTHGRRGVSRLVLGSDAEIVLRSSPVPVLFVRDKPEGA